MKVSNRNRNGRVGGIYRKKLQRIQYMQLNHLPQILVIKIGGIKLMKAQVIDIIMNYKNILF